MFFDPTYILFLSPALLLMFWAQFKVQSAFRKYGKVTTSSGYTGSEAAREILKANGIHDVAVEEVSGFLSDHYDPSRKVLRLSPNVYGSNSAAAVGIAAHEVGHAMQHATSYAPLAMRSALVPAVQIGSFIWMPLFLLGMFIGSLEFSMIGIAAFAAVAVFQIITLPVEFDASKRAIVQIQQLGIMRGDEVAGAKRVLDAAALTYVAAAVQSILTILYFLVQLGVFGRRND